MNVPQTVTASIAHELDGQWTLLGSLGWQDWSEFGDVGVDVDANGGGTSRTVDRKYKDTWHASIGAMYQATPQWRYSVGLGYDSSAVDDEDRTVDNPMGEAWRLAAGINYAVDEGLDLHLAYTLVWLGIWMSIRPRAVQAPHCQAAMTAAHCTSSAGRDLALLNDATHC